MRGAALLLPTLAPAGLATNKTSYLTWTSSEAQFAVYTGSSRATLTNRQVISENRTRLTNGVHYGIAALNTVGIESTLAFWPSNRIGELWLRGSGTNLNQFTNVTRLAGPFTNAPPGLMRFWGVADVTVGWQ
jgi:Leucine-rich repeat (LRR) protein